MARKYYEYSGLGGGEVRKPLTKEQLLIPRYMCTGTPGKIIMPGYTFAHGNIVEPDEAYPKWFFDDFPHLFRPMPWWEGRKPEDMPEYVWYKDKGVFKVDVWDFKYEEAMIFNGDLISTVSIGLLTPATEQEYWDSKPLRKCHDCGSEWKGDDSCPECFPI